jgi:type IV secretory pathway TrbF-like protein
MPDDNPSAIHQAGRREWNERYGTYIEGARQWRFAALGLLLTNAISVWACVQMASHSKVEPYVVEVDQLGESIAVRRLAPAPPPTVAEIKSTIARWIVDVRSVSTDVKVEQTWGADALNHTDSQGQAVSKLDDWYRGANNSVKRSKNETIGVEIDSVSQIGDELSYEADFREHHYTMNGNPPAVTYWRGTFRMKTNAPHDDKTILGNPRGVYVDWYEFSQRPDPTQGATK